MNNAINVNIMDNEQSIEICNYIKDYEKANNIKVKKIAIVKGRGNSKAYYPGLKYRNSVLSWSAIRTEWSIEGLIEKNYDNDLERVKLTNKEYEYYSQNVDKDRDYLCFDDIVVVSYYVY